MADEVRRSGRANKGHHTKNADALDEPLIKPKSKPKTDKKGKPTANASAARSQSAHSAEPEEEEDEEEEDAVIRCVCGDQRDIEGLQMICCDKCEAWQHNKCLHLPQGNYWEGKEYYCEQCKPEDHQELLALMARGEKPWIKWRKGKPPKSRPSDVKPSGKQEKTKTATPQPSQSAAPSPAAAQPNAPTPAPPTATPTPVALPKDTSSDGPNGQADAKSSSSKKEATKSQPQSPLGEKRRHDSTSEKDTSSKKRRKSSGPKSENVASQSGITNEIEGLPPKQKPLVEKLRDTLIPLISTASESRGYQIPGGQTAQSIATRVALDVDRAAVLRHGEPAGPEAPFTLQLRSIIFNVKKNSSLVDQLLSGSLKAEDFASMSSEEMASDEKQREYAAIREANEKQMVLTEEVGPRFRKTHKGEELVDNEAAHQHDEFKPPPPPRERDDEKPSVPQSPVQEGHATVELPEDVDRREPIAVDTTGAADNARRPSTNFDINSVFAQVRSPQNEQQSFLHRRQSSIKPPEKNTQGPGIDADVDRLLKDEDGDVDMTTFSDETIVWHGHIKMQHMESFESVARFVAGGDFGKAIPWNKLLSNNLPIEGRIEEGKGDEYIRGLALTGSHDVAVLALSPVDTDGRAFMDSLYQYFQPRQRWGVVPVDRLDNEAMRDLYVIPIPPGGSNLPQFMDLLEYCTIETPRKEAMLLLALVAKLPDIQPQSQLFPHPPHANVAEQTPAAVQPPNGANGPSPSPLTNPHGPAYSPVGSSFPTSQPFGSNYPPQPNNGYAQQGLSQAPSPPVDPAAILGPYMGAPVVQTFLQNQMSYDQLHNLKAILDKVPAARDSMEVLGQYLAQQNALVDANGNANGT
ncbi:Transcription factor bye1 [Kalmusia sp. IMI 367209]|nr:Transcription factor bye1 [Kalmusia sp. IMI 367209]